MKRRWHRQGQGGPVPRVPALWAISVAVAYWLGREVEFRLWERTNDAPVPETNEDVQPADPWPATVRDNLVAPELLPWVTSYDPSYLEATTLAAIRRSTQSSERPTEGMA